MANVWDVGVARIDTFGNLHLDGGLSYDSDASFLVKQSSTDVGRFDNLQTAYQKAKTATPGGNVLSASNRSCVVVPSGTYEAGANKFSINGDYVDIIAVIPEMGGTDIGTYQPNNVIITGSPSTNGQLAEITATDVRLNGISFVSKTADTVPLRLSQGGDGEDSVFNNLYLWVEGGTLLNVSFPNGDYGMTDQSVRGRWTNCVCSFDYAWRVNGFGTPTTAIFDADMKNCHAGDRSYGGDCDDVAGWETKFLMQNCELRNCIGGDFSFAGCGGWGIGVASTCTFIECESGDNSFGIGVDVQATFIQCRGGKFCAGATTDNDYPGKFSGYSERCTFGGGSLGGASSTTTLDGECSGRVISCVVGLPLDFLQSGIKETTLKGAMISGSLYTVLNDGYGVFKIGEDGGVTTRIIGCSLEMYPGTKDPIDSAVARDVIFAGCTVNNQTNSATGLGSNVTNKAVTAGNGIYNI